MDFELCGIDEAGRGPIAGDLVVVGVVLHANIKGIDDSKKLSPKKRQELFEIIKENSTFHIVTHSAKEIDELGLGVCIKKSLIEIKKHIKASRFLFDGNSAFGVKDIETMIKADEKIKQVGAASIIAKVTRDNTMLRYAKIYPRYQFEKHKGYITKKHIELIKKYGYCDIHRKSYKVKALQKTLFDV